jgi:iron(III) transport system ATP-binding protein
MNAIELKMIKKKYPDCPVPAVDCLSLAVKQGEIITLLGPSGCGKTTTLRLIAGFERPDEGSILLGEIPVTGNGRWIPPEKRNIGMVFQDYALFPHLNTRDNIGISLKKEEKEKKVEEMLMLVNLQGLSERYPHELSGGQQQRVALGRALARNPVVVLLDEPFSNLDSDLRNHMRREVAEIIKAAGTTAVFVTHDLKDALAVSDRVAVLRDGRLEQIGTPQNIYRHPETEFVATFVGKSNILSGIIGPDHNSVITDLGLIPCSHTHELPAGQKVKVSIRADSFELDPEGDVEGVIRETIYGGNEIEAILDVKTEKGLMELLVHIHPEKSIREGARLRFHVLPEFVAVINEEQSGTEKLACCHKLLEQ